MDKAWLRAGRAVVVVAVAAALFAFVLPSTHADASRMAQLSIRNPHVAGLKDAPMMASSVPIKDSSVGLIKTYGQRDPSQTGIYESDWASKSSASNEAGLLVQVVPTVSDAIATLSQSSKKFAKPTNAQGSVEHFSVPHAIGTGSAYAITGTNPGFAYTAIFRVGRVVVIDLLDLSQSHESFSAAQTMAGDEAALLQSRLPTFSLAQTTRPTLGVILVIVGGLVLAAAAYFGPEWMVRRREVREIRAKERARSQYRSRGRRAVTRHQAPAWRQQKKR